MTTADLYEVLGVRRDASDDELKRAYRAKAREFHPDANQGDSDTSEQFKEVSLAYEVLKDPERRARYDRYGAEGVFGPAAAGGAPGDPFGGGLGDLFDAFFNGMGGAGGGGRARRTGPMPGPDAEMVLRLSFREAVFGVQREVDVQTPVHCDTCEGSGAQPGTGAGALSRVPGGRRAAPGAPVHPGPGHHRRPLPALPGHRRVHRDPVPRLPGRGAAERVDAPSPWTSPAGSTRARPSGWPATGRPASGAARTAPSSSTSRWSPTPPSSAPGSTCTPPSTCR